MFATPYLSARRPGARRPGPPASQQRDSPDRVTLTGASGHRAATPPGRDPGRSGRDPTDPHQRLQNDTKSDSGPGTPSPVVSSTCVSRVTV
jgi:hypothetical protein